jgi:hypothetical protein
MTAIAIKDSALGRRGVDANTVRIGKDIIELLTFRNVRFPSYDLSRVYSERC